MKKILSALVLCAGAAPLWAQSSVSLYGIVDSGVEYQRSSAGSKGPGRSSMNVMTGSRSASRLGFKGEEVLGGGLKAFFQIEHGFNVDDGTGVGSAFFGRTSHVGLSGGFGELRLGRDYLPAFWAMMRNDINAFGLYGNSGTIGQIGAANMSRASNGVFYTSPVWSGFSARAAYGLGEEGAGATRDLARQWALSAEYRDKRLAAALFHQQRKDLLPGSSQQTGNTRYSGATLLYQMSGGWKFDAGFTRFDPAGANTASAGVRTGLWAGVLMPLGSRSDLRLKVGQIKTRHAAGVEARSMLYSVNATHNLSKRTSLYAGVGFMDNNAAAQVSLEAAARAITATGGLGSDVTGVMMGIRHSF